MQRRDLLRGTLLLGSGVLLGGLPMARAALGFTRAVSTITLLEDGARDSLPDRVANEAGEIWRLPTGQLLQPDDYALLLHDRAGTRLHSLLGAANHCLLLDALRLHGAELHIEQRVACSTTPRYALHATL